MLIMSGPIDEPETVEPDPKETPDETDPLEPPANPEPIRFTIVPTSNPSPIQARNHHSPNPSPARRRMFGFNDYLTKRKNRSKDIREIQKRQPFSCLFSLVFTLNA